MNGFVVPAETEKLIALEVPPAVVTVTLLSPAAAAPEIANTALTDVALIACAPLMPIPEPDTETVVPPLTKFVPDIATVTVAPAAPLDGAIEVIVGRSVAAVCRTVEGIVVNAAPVKRKPMIASCGPDERTIT